MARKKVSDGVEMVEDEQEVATIADVEVLDLSESQNGTESPFDGEYDYTGILPEGLITKINAVVNSDARGSKQVKAALSSLQYHVKHRASWQVGVDMHQGHINSLVERLHAMFGERRSSIVTRLNTFREVYESLPDEALRTIAENKEIDHADLSTEHLIDRLCALAIA